MIRLVAWFSAASVMMVAMLLAVSDVAHSQPLQRPSEYSKSEIRGALWETIQRAQESLRNLDSAPEQRSRAGSDVRSQPRGADDRPPARIVNGIGTVDYPASGALLRGSDRRSAVAWCSGTLVSHDRFLTAAHCVAKDPTPANYKVFFHSAGFFDVQSIEWDRAEYNFPRGDVAILRLTSSVERILPERINRAATPIDGSTGSIVGFGRTGGINEDYGIKREGFIQTGKCPARFSGIALVCWDFSAEVQNGAQRSNTCNADSGGPLFLTDRQNGRVVRVVAGVTSGGEQQDCLLGDRSYDADVYHYREWIGRTGQLEREPNSAGQGVPVNAEEHVEGGIGRLSAGRSEVVFPFEVSADRTVLMVAMSGDDNGRGRNNFDLYVFRGAGAQGQAVCTEDGPGQFAFCRFQNPTPGVWSAVIRRKSGDGLAQVVVTQLP